MENTHLALGSDSRESFQPLNNYQTIGELIRTRNSKNPTTLTNSDPVSIDVIEMVAHQFDKSKEVTIVNPM
jgi:hypothetical protein